MNRIESQSRLIALLCGAAFVASCNSVIPTASGPSVNPSVFVRAPHRAGTLSIRVHVPEYNAARIADSWLTRGIALRFNAVIGTRAFILERINHAQCVGKPLVCTIAIALPSGKYTPQLTTYARPPRNGLPQGDVLVSAPASFSVEPGVTSQFDLILGGDAEEFTIPKGTIRVAVTVGGAGGVSMGAGLGGLITATIPVTPGRTLEVIAGGTPGQSKNGGFNGGGSGGGSGASDMRLGGGDLANRVIVAGGGGAAGYGANFGIGNADGGAGGGMMGAPGSTPCSRVSYASDCGGGGQGGSQSAAGAGGNGGAMHAVKGYPGRVTAGEGGAAGAFGAGGDGSKRFGSGGGGGGGYQGGGGGGGGSSFRRKIGNMWHMALIAGGGGGGGSSYAEKSATNVISLQGALTGDGFVLIGW